jgi:hypothetical protein
MSRASPDSILLARSKRTAWMVALALEKKKRKKDKKEKEHSRYFHYEVQYERLFKI